MRKLLRIIVISFLVVILAGCAVGPNYERPEIATPEQWRTVHSDVTNAASLVWWDAFGDPELSALIKEAIVSNRDLQIATARVEEFYARVGVSRAELFPQIAGEGAYSRQQSSQTTGMPGMLRNDIALGLRGAWEVDLWGRIRRSNESALATLLSQEATRREVILSLVTGVASAYIELRSLDHQLEILRGTLGTREKSLKLARSRFDAGATSELDVHQAESELLSAKVQIPAIEYALAQQENLLSILVGRNPGQITRGKALKDLVKPVTVPSGLPSDLLMNRPDIVAAEEVLRGANADIGVARGAFFPSISLTGSFGYQSSEFDQLFDGPSKVWSYGPSFNLPLLTFGKLLSSLEVAEARKQQALYQYQKSIQGAFREVNDSLVGLQKTKEERDARADQLTVLQRYLNLAQVSYEGGQSSYLEVLDAERQLFSAQIAATQAEGSHAGAVIQLYKALGGGWVTEAEKLSGTSDPVS